MIQDKLISVIVTNYNHAKYITQALDSLKEQTYKNLEIIIVDDASTDNSKDIIEEWNTTNIGVVKRVIYLDKNQGKWSALNTAISQATGDLVTLQDADDVSCPARIERQLECLIANKSLHNLCLFSHCYTQEDIDNNKRYSVYGAPPMMGHAETTGFVHKGFRTTGINHYYIGPQYEAHGASSLFYKQLWDHGMKFLPGNMGLRCQRAEDSDHNTKLTLLLQKTSILLEPQYCYRRNTSTNGAYLEQL
ncbi:MAG: glycosyltransferase family 2 protein [Candidatus Paceibacterota bacterium]|jgi:glycosyltransferase involved in cell wall biosynthesis